MRFWYFQLTYSDYARAFAYAFSKDTVYTKLAIKCFPVSMNALLLRLTCGVLFICMSWQLINIAFSWYMVRCNYVILVFWFVLFGKLVQKIPFAWHWAIVCVIFIWWWNSCITVHISCYIWSNIYSSYDQQPSLWDYYQQKTVNQSFTGV